MRRRLAPRNAAAEIPNMYKIAGELTPTEKSLFAPDKFVIRRIHRKEKTRYPHEWSFVTIDRADEMTPGILWEELAMNDVNVLTGI